MGHPHFLTIANLKIDKDRVSHNGIQMSKEELCEEVLKRMKGTEELDPELEQVLEDINTFR
jgi:hypothetical protein